MSVIVKPLSSLLSFTLRRYLPICPVPSSSSSSSSSTLFPPRSSSSSSTSLTLLAPFGWGQYGSHFCNSRPQKISSCRPKPIKVQTENELTHLVVLLQLGQHDDDAAPLLPHHVPEVTHRVQHRPLGGNEGPRTSSMALWSQRGGLSFDVLTEQASFYGKKKKLCVRVRVCDMSRGGCESRMCYFLPHFLWLFLLSDCHADTLTAHIWISLSFSHKKKHALADAHAGWKLGAADGSRFASGEETLLVKERNWLSSSYFNFEDNFQSENQDKKSHVLPRQWFFISSFVVCLLAPPVSFLFYDTMNLFHFLKGFYSSQTRHIRVSFNFWNKAYFLLNKSSDDLLNCVILGLSVLLHLYLNCMHHNFPL